jgi:hypothetical protein
MLTHNYVAWTQFCPRGTYDYHSVLTVNAVLVTVRLLTTREIVTRMHGQLIFEFLLEGSISTVFVYSKAVRDVYTRSPLFRDTCVGLPT